MPCVEPFSLFMIDFTMDDKLLISARWADRERDKAFNEMKNAGIKFEPF